MSTTDNDSLDYVLPNNAHETERLDFQHLLLTRTFQGLHRAPLDKALRVLDIGRGTGNWAIAFAQHHPHGEIIGFDLQEKGQWNTAPPNCTFHVADLEAEETWSNLGDFDYIHGRFIVIGVRDWPRLLRRCHEHLLPGRSVEIQEFCMPCRSEDVEDEARSKFIAWSHQMMSASAKINLNVRIMNDLPSIMTDVGFEAVKEEEFRILTGPWMGNDEESRVLGRMGQQNLSQGMHGFGETLFTKILGYSAGEYEKEVEGIVREMQKDGLRTWLPVKVCYARRKA